MIKSCNLAMLLKSKTDNKILTVIKTLELSRYVQRNNIHTDLMKN